MAGDVLYEGAENDDIGISVRVPEGIHEWRFSYGDQYDDVLTTLGPLVPPPHIALFDREFHYLSAEAPLATPRMVHEMSPFAVEQVQQLGPDGRYAIAYLENHAGNDTASALLYRTVPRAQAGWLAGGGQRGGPNGTIFRLQLYLGRSLREAN